MFAHFENALSLFAKRIRADFPDEIVSICAFGSRVRGDHSDDSDFDVLVVVKNKNIAIEERIVEAAVSVEEETGIGIDVVVKDDESFSLEQRFNTPFYRNIEQDGVAG